MNFFLNIATSVCCPLCRLRRKVILAKEEFISSDLGILYPAPKISKPNLSLKLHWRKILPLAPRNYFLLAPTWILLGVGDVNFPAIIFDEMKSIIVADAINAFPDYSIPFHVYTDASCLQLGGAIIQDPNQLLITEKSLTQLKKYIQQQRSDC